MSVLSMLAPETVRVRAEAPPPRPSRGAVGSQSGDSARIRGARGPAQVLGSVLASLSPAADGARVVLLR